MREIDIKRGCEKFLNYYFIRIYNIGFKSLHSKSNGSKYFK